MSNHLPALRITARLFLAFAWLLQLAAAVVLPIPWLINQGWISMLSGVALAFAELVATGWFIYAVFFSTKPEVQKQ